MKAISTLNSRFSTFAAYILIFTALCGCKSKKDIVANNTADTDSVAASLASGYFLRIDTAMRRISFDFDTLDITIERHAADAALSAASPEETVRIRAVGGKIADRRRQTRNAIAGYNRLDTVAYRHASATSRAEHTTTTSVAEPPDTTRIILTLAALILIVSGIALYLRRRKRHTEI
ncbi:LPXTG cell wall anchor domain-containing protein [Muribaculum intestinale]|uniref:LPXTG cell wall anchor domain-containing protein n=1 Tax=Muribaculum intestinale TaxID=1796646 RepID=UPI002617C1B6|nr:LPXTG cell wall anchor domain-containing protein [Muribaculum intestinale]